MSASARILRGRTLPPEFFRCSRGSADATTENDGLSVHSVAATSSDALLGAASITRGYWDVVAFLDERACTQAGVPVGLLPLPSARSVFLHRVEQLQNCRTVVVVVTPDASAAFKRAAEASGHACLRVATFEADCDPWLILEYYRRQRPRTWERDTVTLWWEPNVLLEHQMLWRPATDLYPVVVYETADRRRVAIAWQGDAWKALASIAEAPAGAHIVRVSQKPWDMTREADYFAYVRSHS